MAVNESAYRDLVKELQPTVQLIAVSKIQSIDDIQRLYDLGQRDFGENYVQELVAKQTLLPPDTRWHFIGHLQSNKVKLIAPFVALIQGVDSHKLLIEINKQAIKHSKKIHCLLQVHIAQEETKFGLDEAELAEIMSSIQTGNKALSNVFIEGLMGMASFSDDLEKVRLEMKYLNSLFARYKEITTDNCNFRTLSMGMSADYKMAVEEGSNMVRVGSLLFGARSKK